MVQTLANCCPVRSAVSNSFPPTMSQWSTITVSLYAEMDRVGDSYHVFMKTEKYILYTHTKTKADLEVNF